MTILTPAPATLGLASPALGPWFRHDTNTVTPVIPLPSADLSCDITLVNGMQWRTPANAVSGYYVVSPDRPHALRTLRQQNGSPAFTTGNLVVLLALLPEVELRLWALTQPVPRPDGLSAPAANTPTRPRVRYLAMEVDSSDVTSLNDLQNLRDSNFDTGMSEEEKAAYVGLTFDSGVFGNATTAASELRRPDTDSATVLQNRRSSDLNVKLWCFDHRGRPLDPGAVAAWWAHMATPELWENLWAHSDGDDQRTADVADGLLVHLVSAHEGPLSTAAASSLELTDLTAIPPGSTNQLYQAGAAPVIALSDADEDDTDTMPIPRLSVLPSGVYADPEEATPFAGWTDTTQPFALARDFVRIALCDIEQHLVGLTRTNPVQQDPRRRVTALRNSAANPVLLTSDLVTAQTMSVLRAGTNASAMATLMDTSWGQTTVPAIGGDPLTDDVFNALTYSVHTIIGEGETSAGSAANQQVLFRFDATLPPNCWIRIWPHGRDTNTGARFRMDGGAAFTDVAGSTLVVVPIPDGTASEIDDLAELSFDALVVSTAATRFYADQRLERPVITEGSRLTLPADGSTPTDITLFVPEQGANVNRGTNGIQSGQSVIAITGELDDHQFQLVDTESLLAADWVANTLPVAATSGDTLITTTPAFGQTPEGTLSITSSAGDPQRVHRTRNVFNDVLTFGRPVPTQERLELVAVERDSNTGVIGSAPGRDNYHEAPPPTQAHAGVPASSEVHGAGVALAGPATDALVPIMRERKSTTFAEFIADAVNPTDGADDDGGPTTFAAVLETMTSGVAGDAVFRSMARALSDFLPGRTWNDIKTSIDDVLPLGSVDDIIDTAGLSADQLDAVSAAVDRTLHKTRSGISDFSTALQSAIERAEDFIYLQSPAIDPHASGSGTVDVINAINTRLAERPGLRVMMCVPELWLPNRTAKLEEIRRAGISAALKSLQDNAADRVVLFSPVAGPGRPYHMAATTVIVDDALLISGSTHLWRRGLTFDSSLAVSLFDETTMLGRPLAVRTARVQLLATMLGHTVGLIPDDPENCFDALVTMNASGGLGRIKPGVYPAVADNISPGDQAAWNPDGQLNEDWLVFFAGLTSSAAETINDSIR